MAKSKITLARSVIVAAVPLILLGAFFGYLIFSVGAGNLGADIEEDKLLLYGVTAGAFFLSLLVLRMFLRRQSDAWNLDTSAKHHLIEKDTVAPEIEQTIHQVDRFLWTGQGPDLLAAMKGVPQRKRVARAVQSEASAPPRALAPVYGFLTRAIGIGVAIALAAAALREISAPPNAIQSMVVGVLAIMMYTQQFHPFGGPRWIRPILAVVGVIAGWMAIAIGTGEPAGRLLQELIAFVSSGNLFALIPAGVLLALLFVPLVHLSSKRDTMEGKYVLENGNKESILAMAGDELRLGIRRAAFWGLAWALAFAASTVGQLLTGASVEPLLFIVRMVPAFLVLFAAPPMLRSFTIRIETGPRLRRLRQNYVRRSKKLQHAMRPNP